MKNPAEWLAIVVCALAIGTTSYNCGRDREKELRPYQDRKCPAGTAVVAAGHCLACCPVVNGRMDTRAPTCAVAVCMEDP